MQSHVNFVDMHDAQMISMSFIHKCNKKADQLGFNV
uniref:Uncharacterized protein n=1 Tax=Arundo donax TaxID=35708 RepID=A0A0A9GZ51_ARUDO